MDGKYTRKEIKEIEEEQAQVQSEQYAARQEKKYDRLAKYSLDKENIARYKAKREAYKRKSHYSSDREQYNRYRTVLESMVPDTLDKFQDMKYTDSKRWNLLKHNYRVVNSYEDNAGHMGVEKILQLDEIAFNTKMEKFTGKAKNKANIAVMQLDNELKIGNSQVNTITDAPYYNFKDDKEQLVLKKAEEECEFITIIVGSHLRNIDSEAKLFEYAADIVKDGKPHTLYMLSEKCMCDSCLGVLEQFKRKYPNVDIHVVSNKKERDAKNFGKPWEYRGRIWREKNANRT